MEWRLVRVQQSHGSCAIRVHAVRTRSRTPHLQSITVHRNCIHLGQVTVAIESCLRYAIDDERPIRVEDLSMNGKGVASLDRVIRAFTIMRCHRRRRSQGQRQNSQRYSEFHGASKVSWVAFGLTRIWLVSCSSEMQHTMESACRLSVGLVHNPPARL